MPEPRDPSTVAPRVRRRSLFEYLKRVRVGLFVQLHGAMARERMRVRAKILSVHGLMPLMMKPRNGQRWTRQDRVEIVAHLRMLTTISPYFILFAFPGAFWLLPMTAWWLDQRRQKRKAK
jgi:hypothetical protein